jgi:hypothetical protein
MERSKSTIEFTIRPTAGSEVSVRLRRLSLGWSADVLGVGAGTGVGRSARQALTAALQPLGESAMRALMADLGLLEPSIAVVEADISARGA